MVNIITTNLIWKLYSFKSCFYHYVVCPFFNDASVAHAYASISWIIYDGSRCLVLLCTCLVSLAVFSWVRADHKQDRDMDRDTQLIVGVAGKQCCCFLISCAHTLSLKLIFLPHPCMNTQSLDLWGLLASGMFFQTFQMLCRVSPWWVDFTSIMCQTFSS